MRVVLIGKSLLLDPQESMENVELVGARLKVELDLVVFRSFFPIEVLV